MQRGQVSMFLIIGIVLVLGVIFYLAPNRQVQQPVDSELRVQIQSCVDSSFSTAVIEVAENGRAAVDQAGSLLLESALKRIETLSQTKLKSCLSNLRMSQIPSVTVKASADDNNVFARFTFLSPLRRGASESTDPIFQSSKAIRLKDAYNLFSTYFLSFRSDTESVHITPLIVAAKASGFYVTVSKEPKSTKISLSDEMQGADQTKITILLEA